MELILSAVCFNLTNCENYTAPLNYSSFDTTTLEASGESLVRKGIESFMITVFIKVNFLTMQIIFFKWFIPV